MKTSRVFSGLLSYFVIAMFSSFAVASTEASLFEVIKVYSDKHGVDFIVSPELRRDVTVEVDDIDDIQSIHLLDSLKGNGLAAVVLTNGVVKIVPAAEAPDGWEKSF